MKILLISDHIQRNIKEADDWKIYQLYPISSTKLKWPNADMVIGQRPTAEMRMYNYLCCGYGMWYSCTRKGVHEFVKLFTLDQVDTLIKSIAQGSLYYPNGYSNSNTTLLEDINPLAHHAAFKFGIIPFPKYVLTDEENKTLADIVDVMYFRHVMDVSHVTVFNLMFHNPEPKLKNEIVKSHLFDSVLKTGVAYVDFAYRHQNHLSPWNADGELLTIKPIN